MTSMTSQELQKLNLPDNPGVYFFMKGKEILYIGKATSLKNRVQSYFSSDIAETRGPRIVKMLQEATSVRVEKTDSVLEALILEAVLIKKYQPMYNAKEKSDTSFNYVVITDEVFPRVFTLRERELLQNQISNIKYQKWKSSREMRSSFFLKLQTIN